jgi:hypothetical protein
MLNYEIEIPEEGVKKLAKRFATVEEAFACKLCKQYYKKCYTITNILYLYSQG